MTSAERTARIVELKADIARVRAARRRILDMGQAWAGEGRSRQNADLAQMDATEKGLVMELSALERPRGARSYQVNYR